jgi:hypothetical protein
MEEQQVQNLEGEEAETEADNVDLNRIFREAEGDLNSMFPDGEMRKFLRQVKKNRSSNERFLKGIKSERIWEEDE